MNKFVTAGTSGVLNLLFPRFCYSCHERLTQGWICDSCRVELKSGVKFGAEILSPLSSVTAVWSYDGAVRSVIDDWKFANLSSLGLHIIDDAFSTEWLQEFVSEKFDSIVGIPPHSFHLRQRGFDPVEQITNHVSHRLALPVRNVLTRTHSVKPQVASSTQDRVKNVMGVFRAKEKVNGNILLVDDVMTTGSTLREAAKTLLASGADRVEAIVIASAGARAITQILTDNSQEKPKSIDSNENPPI